MAKRSSGSRKKTSAGTRATKKKMPSITRAPGAMEPAPVERKTDTVGVLARLHVWQIQAVRDVLLVAAVVALFWVGHALRAVTVPLLVALLLAYLFEPLIQKLCRHPRINRPAAVGGLLAVVGVVVVLVLAPAVPLAVGQTTGFVADVRDGRIHERVAELEQHLPATYRKEYRNFIDLLPASPAAERRPRPSPPSGQDGASPGESTPAGMGPAAPPEAATLTEVRARELIEEHLGREIERLRGATVMPAAPEDGGGSRWFNLARGSVDTIVYVFAVAVGIGLLTFLIPFYFFFFSLWYPEVVSFGRQLIPSKNRDRTLELLAKMDRVVAGFVRGRIVISLIMGAMLALGWMICGVPYAVVLGLVVGVFCAIPYLGVIGIPLAVALLFFEQIGLPTGDRMAWWGVLLWPSLVFGIVQLVEGYVLTPLIAGKVTNLDPVTILVAVLAGGSVLGVYGMLLAIPLAACLKILVLEVMMPKIRAWTRGEIADPLPIDRD